MLEERLHDVEPNGTFAPAAALWLSPALGRSGLLRDLSPEEIRLLLGVLCCLSPHGTFAAAPPVIARSLGISERETSALLDRMIGHQWKGMPLLRGHQASSGLRFFAPAPHLLDVRRSLISPAPPPGERAQAPAPPAQPFKSVPREEAIAHSRALYSRPRAEVEAEIERFLQGEQTDHTEEATYTPDTNSLQEEETARHWLVLKRSLKAAGLSHQQADELLRTFPFERIERQLEWLPHRPARNPRAYLIAAIEGDYAPPAGLRNEPTTGSAQGEQPSSGGESHAR